MRTEAGRARIVRPSRTFDLDIAATEADVRFSGVVVSLRYRP
jgi:hypothetical protein